MIKISVTYGVLGYYAIMYDSTSYEPIDVSDKNFKTYNEALKEAVTWSKSQKIPLGEVAEKRAKELGYI